MPASAPNPGSPPAPCAPVVSARRGFLVTALVIVSVLTLTGLAAWQLDARNQAIDAQRFASLKVRLNDEIQRRVKIYRYGLSGIRATFSASDYLSRDEFRTLYRVSNLDEEFPAAHGIAYIDRVRAAEFDDYLAAVRADGAPDFEAHGFSGPGNPDDGVRMIVRYAEPIETNYEALGLDISRETRRRTAARHAMRSGDIAITQKLNLVTGTHGLRAFLF